MLMLLHGADVVGHVTAVVYVMLLLMLPMLRLISMLTSN
jgi:hypothetical protein